MPSLKSGEKLKANNKIFLSCNKVTVLSLIFSEITCPAVPALSNGSVTYDVSNETAAFGFGTAVTYHCNPGFVLASGDRVRNCVGSVMGPGEWSGTAPICEGMFLQQLLFKRIAKINLLIILDYKLQLSSDLYNNVILSLLSRFIR